MHDQTQAPTAKPCHPPAPQGGQLPLPAQPSLGLRPSCVTHTGQSPWHQRAWAGSPVPTAHYLMSPFCSCTAHGLPEQPKEGFIAFFKLFPAGSRFAHFEALIPVWSLHFLREAKRVPKKKQPLPFGSFTPPSLTLLFHDRQ